MLRTKFVIWNRPRSMRLPIFFFEAKHLRNKIYVRIERAKPVSSHRIFYNHVQCFQNDLKVKILKWKKKLLSRTESILVRIRLFSCFLSIVWLTRFIFRSLLPENFEPVFKIAEAAKQNRPFFSSLFVLPLIYVLWVESKVILHISPILQMTLIYLPGFVTLNLYSKKVEYVAIITDAC